MKIQPIDLPALLGAVTWPLIAVIAFTVFRRPLSDLVSILGQRIHKFSFGGLSLELAEVSEMQLQSLETEIRQLDAGLIPQSGSSAIAGLLVQLQQGGEHNYIVIDLGSESSPRWLTSRLYLLAFLIAPIDRPKCFVFVETAGPVRKRFLGTASPDRVRWALAIRYSWLETASATAYASLGELSLDPATGYLADWQMAQLMQQFLANIRILQPTPENPPENSAEWVTLTNGIYEHAKWLDGARIERLLGNHISGSHVVLLPNKTVNDLAAPVLRQKGGFVAVVDADRTFQGLIDRSGVLESIANEYLRQVNLSKT